MSKENLSNRFSDEERARTIIIPTSISPDESREYTAKWRVIPKLSRSGKSTIIVCPTKEEAEEIIKEIKELYPEAELSKNKHEYSLIFPVKDANHAQDLASLIPNTSNTMVWQGNGGTLIFATYRDIFWVINALNDPPPHIDLSPPFLTNQTRDNIVQHRIIFLHSIPQTPEEVTEYDDDIKQSIREIVEHSVHVSGVIKKGCSFALFETIEDINKLQTTLADGRLKGKVEHYRFMTIKEMSEELNGKKKNKDKHSDNNSTSSSSSSFSSRSSSSQASISPSSNNPDETSFIIRIPHMNLAPSNPSNALIPINPDELAVSTKTAMNPLLTQLQASIMGAISSMNNDMNVKRELITLNDKLDATKDLITAEAENTRKHLRDGNEMLKEEVKALKLTLEAQTAMLATLADGIKGYHSDNAALINAINEKNQPAQSAEARNLRQRKT